MADRRVHLVGVHHDHVGGRDRRPERGGHLAVRRGAGGVPAPGPGTRPISAYAETVVKLSTSGPTLAPVDWFMPSDAQTLNSGDLDFGSGGPTALPASMGTPQEPNVILQVGKEGLLYALHRDHLGGFQDGPSASDAVPSVVNAGGGVWSKPAVWPGDGGYVYLLTIHTAGLPGGRSTHFNASWARRVPWSSHPSGTRRPAASAS